LEESEVPAEGGLIFKGVEDLAHWSGPETEKAEPKAVTKPPSTAAPRLLHKRAQKQDVEEKRAKEVPLVTKHKRTLSEGKEPSNAYDGDAPRGDTSSQTRGVITRPKSAELHTRRHVPGDNLPTRLEVTDRAPFAPSRQGLARPSHKGVHRNSDHSLGPASDHSVGKRSARTHSASRRNRTRGHSRGNSCSKSSGTDDDPKSPRQSRREFHLQYRSRNMIEESGSIKRPHDMMNTHDRQTSADRITATPALSTASNSTALSTRNTRSFQTPPNRVSQTNSSEHPDVVSSKSESASSFGSPRNSDQSPRSGRSARNTINDENPRPPTDDRLVASNDKERGTAGQGSTGLMGHGEKFLSSGARSDTPNQMNSSNGEKHYIETRGRSSLKLMGGNKLQGAGSRLSDPTGAQMPKAERECVSTGDAAAQQQVHYDEAQREVVGGSQPSSCRPRHNDPALEHSAGPLDPDSEESRNPQPSLSTNDAAGPAPPSFETHMKEDRGQVAALEEKTPVSRSGGVPAGGGGSGDHESVSRRSINELIKSIDGDLDSSPKSSMDEVSCGKEGLSNASRAQEPWSAWETKTLMSSTTIDRVVEEHAPRVDRASSTMTRGISGEEGVAVEGSEVVSAITRTTTEDEKNVTRGAGRSRGRLSGDSMELHTRESEVPDVVSVSSYGNFPCEDSPAPRDKRGLPTVTQIAAC